MGELLDLGLLTLKDLGFAAESANDPRIRQAATILMMHRVGQLTVETSEKGLLRVVSSGRSFMLRKQFELFLYMGLTFGLIMGASGMFSLWSFIANAQARANAPTVQAPLISILIALGIIVVAGLLIAWVSKQVMERIFRAFMVQIARYRRGQEGEDRIVETMMPVLDSQWTLFRNVTLPKQKADLDAVLIGPTGAWLLEIKAHRGTYRVSGDQWEISRAGRWQPAPRNPGKQATKNAVRLSSYLKDQGISLWIEPVVVWANPNAPLLLNDPKPSVWAMDTLRDELGNLSAQGSGKPVELAQAVSTLTALCKKAIKERDAEMAKL